MATTIEKSENNVSVLSPSQKRELERQRLEREKQELERQEKARRAAEKRKEAAKKAAAARKMEAAERMEKEQRIHNAKTLGKIAIWVIGFLIVFIWAMIPKWGDYFMPHPTTSDKVIVYIFYVLFTIIIPVLLVLGLGKLYKKIEQK